MKTITKDLLILYQAHLIDEEKSTLTVDKYTRDVKEFCRHLKAGEQLEKRHVLEYKARLMEKYAPSSVNSFISSLNSFFSFCGWQDLKVKTIKTQKSMLSKENKELTKAEYERLLDAARKSQRLYLLIQTLCATGIRVSEIKYITVESLSAGYTEIYCKGKHRRVFLPRGLCRLLWEYAKKQNIKNGYIFRTINGNPLDRSNVWSDMKKLCDQAHIEREKVFPHNLRHLFARTFYESQKDIVRLADILGHSSVNTTRIYTMESGNVQRKQIQNLGLFRNEITT